MNTIGIIAEFNPFHNGHLHIINTCKKNLSADFCVVIMSGDFVQRGAPAILDKFTRTRMALECGADLVLELPIYYSLSSAEFFAKGAVFTLDKTGVISHLCFGSECGDIALLTKIAEVLNAEPDEFKRVLSDNLKNGKSYAAAREAALLSCMDDDLSSIISSPNNILSIEYVRALLSRDSSIMPYTIKREGEEYHSSNITAYSSASAIREVLTSNNPSLKDCLKVALPEPVQNILSSEGLAFLNSDSFSSLLKYKLTLEKNKGYTEYLDVTKDLSNKIISKLDELTSFDQFCSVLKSKDLTYSRISRALLHILLNIRTSNMEDYKNDDYTSYVRILGMKKESSELVRLIRAKAAIPVIGNLKESKSANLSDLQQRLFDETILAGSIYSQCFSSDYQNEYRRPLIVL